MEWEAPSLNVTARDVEMETRMLQKKSEVRAQQMARNCGVLGSLRVSPR